MATIRHICKEFVHRHCRLLLNQRCWLVVVALSRIVQDWDRLRCNILCRSFFSFFIILLVSVVDWQCWLSFTTVVCWLSSVCCQVSVVDCRRWLPFPIVGCWLPCIGCRVLVVDCRCWLSFAIVGCWFSSVGCLVLLDDCWSWLSFAINGCWLSSVFCRVSVVDYCRMLVALCRLQVTGC